MAPGPRAVRLHESGPQIGRTGSQRQKPNQDPELKDDRAPKDDWDRWLRGSLRQDDFEVEKQLGRGAFGEVTLVRHPRTRQLFALKKLEGIRDLGVKERGNIIQEVRLLRTLNHPCIISCQESFLESPNELCILTEFCDGGDLEKYLQTRSSKGLGLLPIQRCMRGLVQLCLALHALHIRRILHRDLKSQNILLSILPPSPNFEDDDPEVRPEISEIPRNSELRFSLKLADFGISRTLSTSAEFAQTCIGTPSYMAPEVFDGATYSYASDLWSLGCVLYELCNGSKAFKAASVNALVVKVALGQCCPWDSRATLEAKKLVEGLLDTNAHSRWGLSKVLQQPIVKAQVEAAVEDAAAALPSSEASADSAEEIHPRRWLLDGQLLALGCLPSAGKDDDCPKDSCTKNSGKQPGGPQRRPSWSRLPTSQPAAVASAPARNLLRRPSSLENLHSRAAPKRIARSNSMQALEQRRPQSARLTRSRSQDSSGPRTDRPRARPAPLDGEEEADTDQGDDHYDISKNTDSRSPPKHGRPKCQASKTPSSARGLSVRDWEARLRSPSHKASGGGKSLADQEKRRGRQSQPSHSQEEGAAQQSARRPPLATASTGSPSAGLLKSAPPSPSTCSAHPYQLSPSNPSARTPASPSSTKNVTAAGLDVDAEGVSHRRSCAMLPPRQPQDDLRKSPTKARPPASLHPAFCASSTPCSKNSLIDDEDGDDPNIVSTSPGQSSCDNSWDSSGESQPQSQNKISKLEFQGRPQEKSHSHGQRKGQAAPKTPSNAACKTGLSAKSVLSLHLAEASGGGGAEIGSADSKKKEPMWVRRSASRDQLRH